MSSQAYTIWLTGLSGAGKSTLAQALSHRLEEQGIVHEVLDGDVVRTNLSSELGFSRKDRDTNVKRIGFVAGLLNRHGVPVITAAISPYREAREQVRAHIGRERFIEVYVKASLDTVIARDVKGFYEKALLGEVEAFTGINDPYEAPINPQLTVDTDLESVDESLERIWNHLATRGLVVTSREAVTIR
ncbi:MAG: adenylyl-sulfate kinase [Planctomycetes bacterium]|nr:adenylyl-sulfate kinase [Planctomycetota bacterium]NUQ35863.1 adenylyl-sulfate kinase [Planctomycetaceae bacterium]